MTGRCWMCGRPRGPSPDGLGSHCRRKLATPRPTTRTSPAAVPVAGQLPLEDIMHVTRRPYSELDIAREAARLLSPHDDGATPMEERPPWSNLHTDDFAAAETKVAQLAESAADTSLWAVRLGAAGLEAHDPMAWMRADGDYEVAVQVATSSQITDRAREELLREIRSAVDATVKRVLCLKDA